MRCSSPSSLISVPEYLTKSILSPARTSKEITFPASCFLGQRQRLDPPEFLLSGVGNDQASFWFFFLDAFYDNPIA
jgi:hypothetical protein